MKKLHNKKGASIILALLFFLICATVGSVILAAASANASRIKSERQNENNYLAVRSAGELIKKKLLSINQISDGVSLGGDGTGESKPDIAGLRSDVYDKLSKEDSAAVYSDPVTRYFAKYFYEKYKNSIGSNGKIDVAKLNTSSANSMNLDFNLHDFPETVETIPTNAVMTVSVSDSDISDDVSDFGVHQEVVFHTNIIFQSNFSEKGQSTIHLSFPCRIRFDVDISEDEVYDYDDQGVQTGSHKVYDYEYTSDVEIIESEIQFDRPTGGAS